MSDDKRKMSEVLTELEVSTADMLTVIAQIDRSELSTLLKAFATLHDNRKRLSNIYDVIDRQYRELSEQTLPELFNEQGIEKISVAGKSFSCTVRINASIPEAKSAAGFDWLRNVAKCPELITERVNAKQLSSLISDYFEEHAELPPADAITVHMQPFIGVRKA